MEVSPGILLGFYLVYANGENSNYKGVATLLLVAADFKIWVMTS